MIADKLRKSVLQAAIQGKLTDRRPGDGDARDLLAEIAAEKARLVKEGVIRRAAPLPPVGEDEAPFDIPEGWCWVRLGDCTFNHGQKTPDKDFTYIDIGSINNRENRLGATDSVLTPQEAPSRARKIVHRDDVIYATVRPYLHNACIIDREISPEPIVSTGFAVLSMGDPISNRYLLWALLSPMFDAYANDTENSKGVAYPAINDNKLQRGLIPLPPLAEQRRIVARLEELLPLIEGLAQAEKELEAIERAFPDALRKALLQAAIEGKLTEREPGDGDARDLLAGIAAEKARLVKEGKLRRTAPLPPVGEDEAPFDIPEGWCWVRLGEIISLLSGQDLPPTSYNDQGHGIPYITGASNFQKGEILINRWTEQPKAVAHRGDILITCKGTVGDIAFLQVEEAHIARQVMGITVILLEPCYLANALRVYVAELKRKAKSIIPGIERKNILNMAIPLPPLAEQRRIVARLEELLPLVDELGEMEARA